jgi:phage baseplate assembly protein W
MRTHPYIYSDLKPIYNSITELNKAIPESDAEIRDAQEAEVIANYPKFKQQYKVNTYSLYGDDDDNILVGYDRSFDRDAIRQALINLFLVEKYEVPGKPYLGNPISIKLFELFNDFVNKDIESTIANIVELYEPRVQVDKIKVNIQEELNRLIVEIDYYFIIDNKIVGDTIYIPYAHNTRSYIDNRYIQEI